MLGIAIGVVGSIASLLPSVASVEESGGLHWLFALRGVRPPPANVVVVNIDRSSAEALGVPLDPAKWPRSLHASLVRHLAAAGARVIAFDVFFGEPGPPAEDAALAAAMREAGNVVLTARIEKRFLPVGPAGDAPAIEAIRIGIQTPAESLRESALAVAPFSLPVWPMKVSQFWAFHHEAGDRPTLPAVVLQADGVSLRGELEGILPEVSTPGPISASDRAPGLVEFMQEMRDYLSAEPDLAAALLDATATAQPGDSGSGRRPEARDLIRLYAGPASYFINFYGPPFTIPSIPYHRVIDGTALRTGDGQPLDLRNHIVFVGFAARRQADQRDSFYSVFSEETGLNLSGVEIAATATANLLEGRTLRPLARPAALMALCVWGICLGSACRLMSGAAVLVAALGATAYLTGAVVAFSTADIWLPVIVPVFLQPSLAALGAILLQLRETRRQRDRISTVMGHYVPPKVVERLVAEGQGDAVATEMVHGTCMVTDASQYSLLAETLAPDELGRLMNAYYEILFAEVERHEGQVSDVIGDSMMAIWVSALSESTMQARACAAALRLAAELERRHRSGERVALPTRIGLHSGRIQLGTVGAHHHREYRAVGDIVNTASRIESLNKQLGTRVLVSAETLAGLDGFCAREIGTFLVAGKTLPVTVHELLGALPQADTPGVPDLQLFAGALAEFRGQRWGAAAQLFRRCLEGTAADGPAHFYLRLCEEYLANGSVSFRDGVVRLDQK
ncbi:MAG: hypothetical protein AMXMBFR8_22400 [Nevskiales bacterium]